MNPFFFSLSHFVEHGQELVFGEGKLLGQLRRVVEQRDGERMARHSTQNREYEKR
jgi:hypothetical protein